MSPAGFYRINEPIVASQEIEGEAILIHFDSGCYYCANATGAFILDQVRQGRRAEEIGPALARRFDVPLAAEGTANRFLGELLHEGLVVPAEPPSAPPVAGEPVASRLPFEEPSLQRFDELQDLLMLDPIHDVDQAGWPVPPPPVATVPTGN